MSSGASVARDVHEVLDHVARRIGPLDRSIVMDSFTFTEVQGEHCLGRVSFQFLFDFQYIFID